MLIQNIDDVDEPEQVDLMMLGSIIQEPNVSHSQRTRNSTKNYKIKGIVEKLHAAAT